MAKPPKPSPTQLKILANAEGGRDLHHGRPHTRSDAAGWGCSTSACVRHGWLDRSYEITDAGRAALREARND